MGSGGSPGTLLGTPVGLALSTAAGLRVFVPFLLTSLGGYDVPWLDNSLDTVATPAAITAGVITTAAVTPDLSPLLRWTLAIVAGGGAAGLAQADTAVLRLQSSTFTAGVGKAVVAPGELVGSLALSGLGLLAPSWRARLSSSC